MKKKSISFSLTAKIAAVALWSNVFSAQAMAEASLNSASPSLKMTAPVSSLSVYEIPSELKSQLDQSVNLANFGDIRFRAPLVGNTGPVIALFHGVYGGVSHRAFRELLPRLDAAGARVFIMDLPGVGESAQPKRIYDMAALDLFMENFLKEVVKEPSFVVAESLLTANALKVSAQSPELFKGLILISPTGIKTLATPGTKQQEELFQHVYGDETAGKLFYDGLLTDASIQFYLKKAYYDDSLVTHLLIQESALARETPDQRWLTFSFVGGKLYRPFSEAQAGVTRPVLAIFGDRAEPVGSDPAAVESAIEFQALRPDFQYLVVPEAGGSVHREKPDVVAQAILNFIAP
mgnify:CR=1 FL=1